MMSRCLGVAMVVWVAACGSAPDAVAAPPDSADAPLLVRAVRASSALKPYKGHTFGPENLIDGRLDTSWQPRGGTTLGVGQWVDLDLGGTFEVTGFELELGLQAQDAKLGDLFCRNTRPSHMVLVLDDGAWSLVASPRADAKTVGRSGIVLMRGMERVASAKTRKVRLVIQQVEDPVDWRDVAIAEVRVFGRPTADIEKRSGGECGTIGYVPFSEALVEYCAGQDTGERARLRCSELVLAFLGCRASGPFGDGSGRPAKQVAMPTIAAGDDAKVTVTAGVEVVTFERAERGWRVTRVAPRTMKTVSPESLVREDLQGENGCWESLAKKRPYEGWDVEVPDFGANPEFE